MKLLKSEWIALGKVFEREIAGLHILQSKSRIYADLEARGLVERLTIRFGRDRFGAVEVTGWALTLPGNFAYCSNCERFATDDQQPPTSQARRGRR